VGNTEGRLKGFIYNTRKRMTYLTSMEQAVFLGNLLGDGHVQKRGNSCRSKVAHGPKQTEYVLWKYEKLKRLTSNNHPPKVVQSKYGYETCFFYLNSGPYLKLYHDFFYQPYVWTSKNDSDQIKQNIKPKIRYRKTITSDLVSTLPLDPMILAVWYMDDGSLRAGVSGCFATQCFLKHEVKYLQHYVGLFGIKTQIVLHNRKKSQYTLTIPAKHDNFKRFIALIKDFVLEVPCMHYKLPN